MKDVNLGFFHRKNNQSDLFMQDNQALNIEKLQFGIVGNGSWATALAKILTDNELSVHWWMRQQPVAMHLASRFHNPHYLSSVVFGPDRIFPSSNLDAVIRASNVVILATPSAYMEPLLEQLPKDIFKGKIILSAVKGILPEYNRLINDFLSDRFGFPLADYVAITGPCHAEEVAEERLSYLTFSGLNPQKAELLSQCFRNNYIRTTVNHDIWGSQYAAVLKNIYAVGAGLAHGAGYGDNFLSVYITNCYREMHGFLTAQFEQLHPSDKWPDFLTSAYLGDLLVTCYSPHSRNRTLGALVGKGYSVKAAIAEMNMVAEGYFAAKGMKEIAEKLSINMPIANTVFKILWEAKPVEDGFSDIKSLLN